MLALGAGVNFTLPVRLYYSGIYNVLCTDSPEELVPALQNWDKTQTGGQSEGQVGNDRSENGLFTMMNFEFLVKNPLSKYFG